MATRLFLLTEGGVAGHMSHLYEQGEMTFAKLKEIFTAASNGELEGTEKTDGQNLFISYSVQRGVAVAARGKGNIKAGGLNAEELASKFEGRGNLADAFNDSFATFEKAVRSLDPKTQLQIFGEDAEVYYNAEVMDPRSPNVVNYDTKSLVIHQVGHGEFDKATGNKTEKDVSKHAKVLSGALERMQEVTADDEYTVHINAIRQLEALEDDVALHDALEAIDKVAGSVGLSDSATVSEYLVGRLAPVVEQAVPEAEEETHKLILQRLLGAGVTLTGIVKGMKDKELKNKIRAVVKKEKQLLTQAVAPLELIVHEFGVEMLKSMESAFVLDNNKESERLRAETRQAINGIKKLADSGNESAINLLKKHLEKLKDIESAPISTSEGFVFDYDGQTFKFTGNFAPINQLLGVFKYGRGDIPASIQEEGENVETADQLFEGSSQFDVAVVPGAFKPPHRGHLAMIGEYAKISERVIVFMSPLARDLPDGRQMTFDMAFQLWDAYLGSAGLDNVKVLESPVNSPVGASFKFVANEEENPDWAQPGEKVVLASSTKGGDDSRFGDKVQKYAREGVTVVAKAVEVKGDAFVDTRTGEPLSASTMRQAIANRDMETFIEYIPDGLRNNAEELMNKLTPEEAEAVSEMIIRLINEGLEECGTMAAGGISLSVGTGSTNTTNVWDDDEDEDEYEDLQEFMGGDDSSVIKIKSLNIPRSEMPQIKSTDMQDFRDWLESQGVDSNEREVPCTKLMAIQSEINTDKINGMLKAKTIEELSHSKPVLSSSDGYLIDGHHRWFALRVDDQSNTISTIQVNLNINELLKLAHEYPKVSYKSTVEEMIMKEVLKNIFEAPYENFKGNQQVIKVGSVILDIEDLSLEPTKHGEERRFRHQQQSGKGHKISKEAIVSAVDRAMGLIMNDYANGEIANGEAFHIRMKGKSRDVPALNVIAALEMKKGPDTMKVITVMRKDEFKTDNFGSGGQKTYNVGMGA